MGLDTWQVLDDITLQTTFAQTSNELQRKFTFKFGAYTRRKDRFSQIIFKDVGVVIGCFQETVLTSAINNLPTVGAGERQEVFRYDQLLNETTTAQSSVLKFRYQKELAPNNSVPSNFTKSYVLNDLISWTTDIALCYASNISLCTDEACTTLMTSAEVQLDANPTNKDSDGLLNPTLFIDRRTSFSKFIYIKGTTNSGLVSSVFKANVFVCGEEEIDFIFQYHPIFQIHWYQEPFNKLWETFDLSTIFEVRSTSINVLPADCPIHHYVICETANCSNSTNITTTDRF